MGKVLQNKLRKQQALLDSAYELFTTIGFTRTTIRNIALKADVAKGTFYLYFNDKVEIRDALIRAKASQLLQKAFASMEDRVSNGSDEMDTAGKFIYIIDYIIDYISGDINFVKFMSKHLSWGLFTGEQHKVQYHDENMAPVTDFQEYIHLMLERDGVKIREPQLLIFTLMELVSSTCYDLILYTEPVSIEEFKPYLYHNIRLLVNDAIIA